MTINRKTQRHGIIVQKVLTSDALDGGDAATVKAEWDEVDPDAAAILRGYIAAADDVMTRTPKFAKDGRKRAAIWMAARATRIHARAAIDHLDKGDAENAVWNALVAAHNAWIMDVKSVEPQIVTGSRVRRPFESQNKDSAANAIDRYAEWQRRANEKWAQPLHANKSVSCVAKLIVEAGENWDTIRRHIKKLS